MPAPGVIWYAFICGLLHELSFGAKNYIVSRHSTVVEFSQQIVANLETI
jgi:hypothetical protein